MVNPNQPHQVNKSNLLYKCGWSPLLGQEFHSKVEATFVNGQLVYNKGEFLSAGQGKRLLFNRSMV